MIKPVAWQDGFGGFEDTRRDGLRYFDLYESFLVDLWWAVADDHQVISGESAL